MASAAYEPRDAERSVLYRVVEAHLEIFLDAAAHHAEGARHQCGRRSPPTQSLTSAPDHSGAFAGLFRKPAREVGNARARPFWGVPRQRLSFENTAVRDVEGTVGRSLGRCPHRLRGGTAGKGPKFSVRAWEFEPSWPFIRALAAVRLLAIAGTPVRLASASSYVGPPAVD